MSAQPTRDPSAEQTPADFNDNDLGPVDFDDTGQGPVDFDDFADQGQVREPDEEMPEGE